MLNNQPIEKRVTRTDGMLDVHSIFHTIQGEGPFAGTPCVFVRLAGCNLQCPACDTIYTTGRYHVHFSDVVGEVVRQRRGPWAASRLVVITGGEPFRQPIGLLIELLLASGFYVQVESNGAFAPAQLQFGYELDTFKREGAYIVVSPKTGKLNPQAWVNACAAKYVVTADESNMLSDGLPARALDHTASPHIARPPEGWRGTIYVQPQDDKDEARNLANTRAAVESSLAHGHILQLQIHKYIGVE